MPPNRLFRHFRASTGVCDVARFQKTAEKWNRATFTGHRTCQSGRRHATMARKRVQDSIPFIYLTFRPSPIRNKNQESRKRQHSDRNNSHPDMRRGTSQKPPHTNRKRPRQRPRFMMLLASKIHQNIRSFSQEGISRD